MPLLSKFSKYRSNSSNKLCMKRWHCIFNTIVKESALKGHFIFHFCICLRNFAVAFDTICAFQSSVVLYNRHPSLKAHKNIFTFLVSFQSRIYLNKSSLSSGTQCLYQACIEETPKISLTNTIGSQPHSCLVNLQIF